MFGWRIVLLLGFLLLLHQAESKEKCTEVVQQEVDEEACQDTTYESYVECMRKRSKRSLDCYEDADCEDCDCSSCEYGDCGECSSCCESYEPITSCRSRSCCHSTCNASCRTSSCRKRCRSSCRDKITENLRDPSTSNSNADFKHNITTVINLHNLINNTNIIDMPITINNTNLNNITLDNRGGSSNGCCKIIGPRQCVPTPTYPFSKCFHMRKNHCGSICTNPIMHAEPHQICEQTDGQNRCEQMVSFIPQPKPSCAYTSVYPYVSCTVNEQNCVGCYNHMFNGGTPPAQCTPNCYDHNHNVGPMQNGMLPNVPISTFNQMLGGYPAMGGVEGAMGMAGMGSMGGYGPMEGDYQVMPASNHSRRNADPGIGELMKALQEEPKMDSDKIQHE